MNNVNMGGMGNPMGGPVGGGMPMMNNGMAGGQPRTTQDTQKFRALLNTYIYDYFITNEMGDCARALINSKQPLNLNESKGSRDENGNVLNNGVTDDNGDEMKVDSDSKRLGDLPAPQLPDKANSDSNFLYDWWCLFWEMYAAQRGETGQRGSIKPYLNYTQQARQKSEQQANALRQMRPDLMNNNPAYQQMLQMRNQQNGMMPNEMARKAIANSRNATPQQQLHMLKQQQQMQRDGSDMDGNRRPQSPNGSENAPSPSKRPKLEGAPFNGQQGMMPNGRGQTQGMGPGQQVGPGPSSANLQAQMLQLGVNVNAQSLTPQQFQVLQAAQAANKGGVQAYAQSLAQHQQKQMPVNGMPNGALPQGQGSPMMTQGGDGIYDQYNANGMGPNGMPRGAAGQAGAGGNHALQDYQMQLMLLEQQNKKRLMMARQEQDTFTGGREGSVPVAGVQGPNGQPMQGTSPQAPRPGVSPNPNDMKRGTPQMGNAGIPSPGDQARNSPNINFIQGQMDPNMNPAFYNQMKGMEGGMVPAGMQNGMRPPNAQPGFGNQMNAHQMAIARQQQQQQQQQQQAAQAAAQIPGWQGPNGAPMMNQPSQQGQQQPGQQQGQQGQQGVPTPQPQQRAMLPPSAPVAAANGNARTQPSSPQQPPAPPTPSQANKANPKAKKDNKERKKPVKKGATATTGATPSAETAAEPATPTPATPITPVHPASFNKNQNGAAAQPTTNGQAPAPAPAPVITGPSQQDTTQQPGFLDDSAMFGMSMGFDNASMGNTDVLQDFDFDSFLHQDGDNGDAFAFDPSGFNMEGGEIGAE